MFIIHSLKHQSNSNDYPKAIFKRHDDPTLACDPPLFYSTIVAVNKTVAAGGGATTASQLEGREGCWGFGVYLWALYLLLCPILPYLQSKDKKSLKVSNLGWDHQ
jgi:hypothetical protein